MEKSIGIGFLILIPILSIIFISKLVLYKTKIDTKEVKVYSGILGLRTNPALQCACKKLN